MRWFKLTVAALDSEMAAGTDLGGSRNWSKLCQVRSSTVDFHKKKQLRAHWQTLQLDDIKARAPISSSALLAYL